MIAVGVSLLLVVAAFLVLLFRHLHSVRQLAHLERMRSLEAGFPLEASDDAKMRAKFMHNAFWISFWLVVSVPGAAMSAASAGTAKVNGNVTLLAVIWSGAALASIAAVAGATVLMLNTRPRRSEEDANVAHKFSKPMKM